MRPADTADLWPLIPAGFLLIALCVYTIVMDVRRRQDRWRVASPGTLGTGFPGVQSLNMPDDFNLDEDSHQPEAIAKRAAKRKGRPPHPNTLAAAAKSDRHPEAWRRKMRERAREQGHC